MFVLSGGNAIPGDVPAASGQSVRRQGGSAWHAVETLREKQQLHCCRPHSVTALTAPWVSNLLLVVLLSLWIHGSQWPGSFCCWLTATWVWGQQCGSGNTLLAIPFFLLIESNVGQGAVVQVREHTAGHSPFLVDSGVGHGTAAWVNKQTAGHPLFLVDSWVTALAATSCVCACAFVCVCVHVVCVCVMYNSVLF